MFKQEVKGLLCRITAVALLVCLFMLEGADFAYAEGITPSTGKFEYIAYSFIKGTGDAPVNSAAHFNHCCSREYSYSMLKGDLRLTADNRIVMCHDPGFTLNKKGRIVEYDPENNVSIHDLTYDECLALQYEPKYKGKHVNVCGFDKYLSICASNNKKAYITIRNKYAPELVESMMASIRKYNMKYDCVINSGSVNILKLVREYDPAIRLSLIAKKGCFGREIIDQAAGLGNCLVTIDEFSQSSSAGMSSLAEHEEDIIYAQENDIPLYVSILDDTSLIKPLKKLGISGAQLKVDSKAPFDVPCGTVKVTSVSGRTATLIEARNKRKIVIPATVTKAGKTYKLTTIEADAFTGKQIRTVVIGKNVRYIKKNAFRRSKATYLELRTRLLKRKNVKGAFRGSGLKKARLTLGGRKLNKVMAAKYKVILSGSVTGRTLKIVH